MKRDQKILKYQKRINETSDPIKRSFYVKKLRQYGGNDMHRLAIDEIQANVVVAQGIMHRIASDKKTLEALIENNKSEINELKQQLRISKQVYEGISKSYKNMSVELVRTDEKVTLLEGEIDRLKRMLNDGSELRSKIENDIVTKDIELRETKQREVELRSKVSEYEDALMREREKYTQLNNKYTQCIKEKEEMTRAAQTASELTRTTLLGNISEEGRPVVDAVGDPKYSKPLIEVLSETTSAPEEDAALTTPAPEEDAVLTTPAPGDALSSTSPGIPEGTSAPGNPDTELVPTPGPKKEMKGGVYSRSRNAINHPSWNGGYASRYFPSNTARPFRGGFLNSYF